MLSLLLISLLFAASMHDGAATANYNVFNNATGTPGGTRFDSKIGPAYCKHVLVSSAHFIWATFHQPDEIHRKSVQHVNLYIESMDGVAYTSNNDIHVSADYIAKYSGDVKTEITGVLYHEHAHVWQWDGKRTANSGLIEGIADYVRLKAGYAPRHWVRPGQGDRWDQGYDVTAWFLNYLSGLKHGFVAVLNAKMKDGYSNDFFLEILGKTVDQLWIEYKAAYGG